MNAPRQDWGAPEPGGVDCGCGGGCGDSPPHMPRGAWERDDDELGGLQPPRRSGPVPDWDPDEQGDDDLINAKARAAAHFGAWALATDPDVIDMGLPNVSMDVYFSAGPSDRSPPFGCSYRIMENAEYEPVCSLYRVRLTPTRSGKPDVEVWRIKAAANGYRDRFQPALAPDGKKLAYTIRYRDTQDSGKTIGPHAIGVKDIDTLEFAKVDAVARGDDGRNGGLQHPSWYSDSVLTWTEIGGGTTASESVDGIRWAKVKSGTTVTALTPSSVLGKNAGVESRQELDRGLVQPVVDFADGDRQPFSVANNKDDRVLVLHSKDFEGSYDSGSENGAVPIVVKLPADTRSTVKYERFELGVREGGELVRECHHPTWSTENEVMCHDHEGKIKEKKDGIRWRELLVYSKENSKNSLVWAPSEAEGLTETPAFSVSLATIRRSFRAAWFYGLSEAVPDPGSVSFKYAQFCPNPSYVVSTLMVATSTDFNRTSNGFSRVALVHRTTGEAFDLTLFVEAYEGVSKGTLGAFAPTAVNLRAIS